MSEDEEPNTLGGMLAGMVGLSALSWFLDWKPAAQGFVFGATTMLAMLCFIAWLPMSEEE